MIHRKAASKTPVVARLPAATKLFVLDTNVLMHDPTSLFRFEEHDLFLPMVTLEELDGNKKGMSEVSRNARQASRYLDEMVSLVTSDIAQRHSARNAPATKAPPGKLFLQTEAINGELPARLPSGKADNQIIGVVKHLQELYPARQVILVSKDINMRIKARALGFAAEDYFNDKVLEDTDLLYTGRLRAAGRFLGHARQGHGILATGGTTPTTASTARCAPACWSTSSSISKATSRSTHRCSEVNGKTAVLQTLKRLHPSAQQRLGHHRAQPRAEFRAQSC